jgi:uncharacterized SAM-binding protein YcdF (DUF218 family)
MTLPILFLLTLIAIVLAVRKRRRASRALFAGVLALVLFIGCGPAPRLLLDGLQSDYGASPSVVWGKRNAIVLLGASTQKIPDIGRVEPGAFAYARIVQAAALYAACKREHAACAVVVSGGDARKHGTPEADVYGVPLRQLGVAAADLVLENRSMNTWQNAQFSAAVLKRLDADRVLLVSSGIHLRRSLLYFSHFGVNAAPARADYLNAVLSPLPLAYNLALTDFALHEYAGIARYHLYNALGWNIVATRAGAL